MSNEIATYSMILSKLSLGKSGTECPTKTLILAINSLIVIDNASTYGANECVKIDDIRKKVETWNYYLTVSPTSMSFGASGGSKLFTYSSYKRKVLDGVELSGDISVSLKTTSASGTGFSISGTTVSASANEGTSNRTGTVTITQNESNKTATISLSQSGNTISSYGEWTISVSASPTSVSSSGGTSTITASAKRTVYWASGDVTEETGNPTLSTNLGSLSSSSSPSTLTLGENTSTSSRTATIKATHGGKSATCTVTQAGAEPTIEYVFTISPWQVNVGASGGTGDIGFTSYKLVNGNQISLGYSIDSSTLPSWATYSNGRFTISSNSSTSSRSANVYFTLSESGKRDYATISQSGYVPPADNYVFTWEGGSTSDVSASFLWDFSTNGTAANIPVVSTKNGSSQSWSVSSKPSWITTSTTSSKVTISASDNSGSARSGEVVLTQSGSGKTLTVNVSQDAYVADTYVFTMAPNTYDAPYSNATFIPRTVSTKNGSNIGCSLTSGGTDWVVVGTTGNVIVEILKNTTSNTRSTTLVFTLNESGKTQSIKITQSGRTPTYTFNVTPTNLSVTAAETNETLTVNSYKTVLKSDGSETTESLDYEFSSDTSWVNAARTTTNTTYVTVALNLTTNLRSAKITLTQAESGAQVFTNVIQAGKAEEVVNKLTLNSLTYDNGYLFLSGTAPVKPNAQNYFMFIANYSFNWYASRGITVNGGTAYAGNIVNIYVYSSGSYKLVKSFLLQLGEQTVTY
ncbi:lipocalin-like protein [uncultured phage cr53_1]|uniref:Lipocalin-like protein n=1 Tax=uncultured phage cr53_1 TaxID=2772080 RepID=A0A7M1RQM0_9CAUD|nr:lipocalin-like protein [uncultured phage cr53_1]QOR56745.1 lipocalin-like protein [uncultured phage cr53_1]